MISQYFCHVINNTIIKSHIRRGRIYNSKKFGKLSPDNIYRNYNLYPEIGEKPNFDSTIEKLIGPIRNIDEITKTVNLTWTVTAIPTETIMVARLQALAVLRDFHASESVTIGQQEIPTDEASLARYMRLHIAFQIDPNKTVRFKKTDGRIISVTKTIFDSAYAQVEAHIEACDIREEELQLALNNDLATDLTIGWP